MTSHAWVRVPYYCTQHNCDGEVYGTKTPPIGLRIKSKFGAFSLRGCLSSILHTSLICGFLLFGIWAESSGTFFGKVVAWILLGFVGLLVLWMLLDPLKNTIRTDEDIEKYLQRHDKTFRQLMIDFEYAFAQVGLIQQLGNFAIPDEKAIRNAVVRCEKCGRCLPLEEHVKLTKMPYISAERKLRPLKDPKYLDRDD